MKLPFRDLMIASGRGAAVAVRDCQGEGPAVVLLHGAGLNLALWDDVIERLSPEYRVVAIDFLGHGGSALPGTYSLHADLAAVEAVIETLGLERPAIVGHSYGGILAVEYGATHPECPLAVNLDGHAGRGRADHHPGLDADKVIAYWAGRLAWIDTMVPDDDDGDDAWREAKIAEAVAQVPPQVEKQVHAVSSRSFQPAHAAQWEHRPPRGFLLPLLKTLFQLDFFSAYHRVLCPVVVAVASGSRTEEAEFAEFVDAYHVGLEAAVAANPLVRRAEVVCGHNVPVEQPDWVADLIRQSLPTAPAA